VASGLVVWVTLKVIAILGGSDGMYSTASGGTLTIDPAING
jgi:hypothetical protein